MFSQLRGNNPVKLPNNKSDIEIQIIDWYADNLESTEDDDSDSEQEPIEETKKKYKDKKFMIKAYGSTIKGSSICINISGYPPHFYIEIPDSWSIIKAKMFVANIKNRKDFPDYLKESIKDYTIIERKKFRGFTNNKLFKFIQISFSNTSALYAFNKIVNKLNKSGGMRVPGLKTKNKHEIYESNIPPLLRFFHRHEIFPAGWIKLLAGKYEINSKRESMTQLELNIKWADIEMIDKTEMAPFIIASYDIEADSSHGDFPLPIKTYKKLATELIQVFYNNKLDAEKNVSKVEDKIYNYIKLAFKDGDDYISKIYTKRNIKPNEAKIKAMSKKLRKIIMQKETYKILIIDILSNYHHTNINQDTYEITLDNWKKIKEFITDAFCDNDSEKQNFNINKIFTKQNNKPTHSLIMDISKKMMNCYSKFIDNVDEENLQVMFDVLGEYYKIYSLDLSDRIEYLYNKFNKEYTDYTEEEFKEIISGFIGKISTTINQCMSIIDDRLPDIDTTNETKIKRCDTILSNIFPQVEGDKVIQIGTTVQRYGEKECFIKHIVTLDTCSKIDGTIVEECTDERDVLIKWTKFIQSLDPDIITGYNIFGFDYAYMYNRAKELNCIEEFTKLSRIRDKESELIEKTLASSALGENKLTYLQMDGRVQLDLFKIIQRDHNLVSYKLDYVAETFINDSIVDIKWDPESNTSLMKIKGIINLNNGNYITLNIKNEKYRDSKKLQIVDIDYDSEVIIVNENILEGIEELNIEYNEKVKCQWTLAKDDVTPNDIFRFQKQGPDERRIVAVYCIQDCALCLHIINKLQIITNNIAMANVCYVPLSFIFLRGQGIKILSLVSRTCKKENFLLPVIKMEREETKIYNPKFEYELEDTGISEDDGYEGAIVLKPHPGIYLKKYTVILDYASLYPSGMISENLCHTSIILPEDKKYQGDKGIEELKKLGYGCVDIPHDVYKWVDPKTKSKGKVKTGVKTCRFVQLPDNKKSVIPSILQDLLAARKSTKKRMKNETDEFQKAVLDGLQLAYKITANSVYGQIGASTSAICLKDIAASTTATGRKLLYLAKDKIEEKFEGAKAIYGDTDSVFIDFSPKDEDGNAMTGKAGLKKAIDLGVEAEKYVQQFLKPPHKLEYEKTFWPFILFSKKRYIGYKYEFDINNYKETSMGIVLKRRDNANIVKHTYGSVIDILLKEQNLSKSISTLQSQLMDLLDGKYPMDMLVISKSLRGYYKNPQQMAHKVLADRMGKRDPGNKPMVNDRIPFVYIQTKESKNVKLLQGDRVEHPDYIKEHKIKPDYKFYITNQILKPVCQIYALIAEKLDGFKKGPNYYEDRYQYLKKTLGHTKALEKVNDMRFNDASDLVFGEVLRVAENRKNRTREISDFFKVTKK